MAITDPEHDEVAVGGADTLAGGAMAREPEGAVGATAADDLEDRLLHRELKARLFGSDVEVRVGRYEVVRRIGGGGMGTVYDARDPELDRRVALKLLRPDRRHGSARMLQEARALARLSSPHVVAVHEVGTHDGLVYLAMELIAGQTLRQWLATTRERREIYDVLLQAARGLQAAHAAQLVHRDVKPDNLLIGDDGRVRVVDFGLAKTGDDVERSPARTSVDASARPTLTITGALLGTPAYMSPEQFLGADVDARTDVFAFSVVAFETLGGRRPFEGSDVAALASAVLEGRARAFEAPGVPGELAALIERGLSRRASDRPQTLAPFVRALEAALVPRARGLARRVGVVAGAMAISGVAVYAVVREPIEPGVVAAAPPDPVHDDPVQASSLAELLDTSDPSRRLAIAEAFLATHGDAAPWRAAIAHGAAAAVLWQRSCPSAINGLCVEVRPELPVDCGAPPVLPMTRVARDAELVAAARRHLDAVMAVSGVTAVGDDRERRAFAYAVAEATLTLADADLEPQLALAPPGGLDFEGARGLSEEAFRLFIDRATAAGGDLVARYAAVKPFGDVRASLRAAGRTGLLYEGMASALLRIPVDVDVDAVCAELRDRIAHPLQVQAADAYDWCRDRAAASGLEGDPAAHWCLLRGPLARPRP